MPEDNQKNKNSSKKSHAHKIKSKTDQTQSSLKYKTEHNTHHPKHTTHNRSFNPETNQPLIQTLNLPSIPVHNKTDNALNSSGKQKKCSTDAVQIYDDKQAIVTTQLGFYPLPFRPSEKNFKLFNNQIASKNPKQLLPNPPISEPTTTYNYDNYYPPIKKKSKKKDEPLTFKTSDVDDKGIVLFPTTSFAKFVKKMAKIEEKKKFSHSETVEKASFYNYDNQKPKPEFVTILKRESVIFKGSKSVTNREYEKSIEKKLLSSDWAGAIKKFKTYNPTNRREYWQHFFTSNNIFSVIEKADYYVKSAIIGFLLGQKFHAALLLKESLKEESHKRIFILVTLLKNLMKKVPFKEYKSMYSIDIKSDIPLIPSQMSTILNILTTSRENKFTKSEKIITEQKLKIYNLIEFSKEDEFFKILLTFSRKFLISIAKDYYMTYGFTICDHVEENINFSEYMRIYVNHLIPIFIDPKNYIVQYLGYCVTEVGDPFLFWHIIMFLLEDGKLDIISAYEKFYKESIVDRIKKKVPIYLYDLILSYIKLYIPEYNKDFVEDKE